MKTIKYTLGILLLTLPFANFGQAIKCTTPEKVFSTETPSIENNMLEIESVVIPGEKKRRSMLYNDAN